VTLAAWTPAGLCLLIGSALLLISKTFEIVTRLWRVLCALLLLHAVSGAAQEPSENEPIVFAAEKSSTTDELALIRRQGQRPDHRGRDAPVLADTVTYNQRTTRHRSGNVRLLGRPARSSPATHRAHRQMREASSGRGILMSDRSAHGRQHARRTNGKPTELPPRRLSP